MRTRRAFPMLLLLLLLALGGAACGDESSGDDAGSGSEPTASADGAPSATDDAPAPEPGSPEAAQARLAGGGGFSTTPAMTTCLADAGFAAAPELPTGAIVAFAGDGGALVAVAADSGAALQVASELGTDAQPASVDDRFVSVGPADPTAAALACLRAG